MSTLCLGFRLYRICRPGGLVILGRYGSGLGSGGPN